MTIEEAACVHHWVIEGNHGKCKFCNRERDFYPDYDSYNRVMGNHSDKDWQARWAAARQAMRMGYADWNN